MRLKGTSNGDLKANFFGRLDPNLVLATRPSKGFDRGKSSSESLCSAFVCAKNLGKPGSADLDLECKSLRIFLGFNHQHTISKSWLDNQFMWFNHQTLGLKMFSLS